MRFLKNSLVLMSFGASWIVSAPPVRYLDNVFANATVSSNIVYGSNSNVDGSLQTLKLDLYQPSGDTAKARPLVLFLFGGGFAVGTKNDGDMVLLSQTFAKKGYVAASIQYRLDPGLLNSKPAIPVGIAEFRAMQDAKAAVRFLRAHKDEYRIDDSRIFMGGCSAGAFISLAVAFLDAKEIPSYIDTNKVGGLEGNSGTPGLSSAIHGVINNWGAVLDSAWLVNNDIPVISFAGTADPEVPYDHKAAMCGSACIDRVLKRQQATTVLKPFAGMGHGMPSNDRRYDTLLTMASKFAYDVLFKDGSTAIRDEGISHPWLQPPGAHWAGFNEGFGFAISIPSRPAFIYSLNGTAIEKPRSAPKAQSASDRLKAAVSFQE